MTYARRGSELGDDTFTGITNARVLAYFEQKDRKGEPEKNTHMREISVLLLVEGPFSQRRRFVVGNVAAEMPELQRGLEVGRLILLCNGDRLQLQL